ncbi:MAG: glutamate 5-kinase [Treponema sp.]|jgi:glutamate 5-kinase|nr:glutamate 5-kinase [Treponema sp.]
MSDVIPRLFAKARKIVFKFGSNTLAGADGKINGPLLGEFAEQAAALIGQGRQIVIVSSGAQVAGLSAMDRWARKRDIHYRQALCAVGQVKLMNAWERAFAPQGIHIAQILLTRDDFGDHTRTLNTRNTLFTLVDEGIVPIINENDSVSVEEIKIGDNDTLAAQSAILWSADLLVLFSDIDGLYSQNPKENPAAVLVSEVRDIAAARSSVNTAGASDFGTGGIVTKLDAAEQALSYGIPLILAHGGRKRALEALAAGAQSGTAFLP